VRPRTGGDEEDVRAQRGVAGLHGVRVDEGGRSGEHLHLCRSMLRWMRARSAVHDQPLAVISVEAANGRGNDSTAASLPRGMASYDVSSSAAAPRERRGAADTSARK